ncbi:MAG: hypothetical protein ACRCWI_00760 [Brevinema sp.]
MENIINYVFPIDLYTLVSLAVLFGIVFIVLIYKRTQKPKIYYQEDREDIYMDQNSLSKPSVEENHYATWLFVDLVSITTFSLIIHVLLSKKIEMIIGFRHFGISILLTFVIYYLFIKPTLFNTHQK